MKRSRGKKPINPDWVVGLEVTLVDNESGVTAKWRVTGVQSQFVQVIGVDSGIQARLNLEGTSMQNGRWLQGQLTLQPE